VFARGMTRDDDIANAATVMGTVPTGDGTAATGVGEPVPQVIADRYEILGLLGAGAMGRVYRARDRSLDELVALKLVRHELLETAGTLERFRQEVKLARRVTSEHVVRTFDLGQHGRDHFLTMELVEGSSLARLLARGPVPLDEALRILRAACAGMAAAHAAGVTHRDLKPDNILVERTGRIAITDFGIARIESDPARPNERFVGTPAYMAPEQVDSASTTGPRADVYALGTILFEMLTRRLPFVGGDAMQVAYARLREPAPDPRTLAPVPDALATIVVRCLSRDPAARFTDAGELGAALGAIVIAPIASSRPHEVRVPDRASLALAILPLRGSGDLADIAEGLTEEIVDVLSMTPALRVRPLSSVRAASQADADAFAVARALGVDVVVDGSLRRRGEHVRLSARAIGVDDGFQLWASHIDTTVDGLLSAGDAQAIASALTVKIQPPARAAGNARATAIYLECKARLRTHWLDGEFVGTIAQLEEAHELVPDDAAIQSTLAMAYARTAFYTGTSLSRARTISERVIAASPESGEAWQAHAFVCHYDGAVPEATRAFLTALAIAPGLAMAQAALGGILLEAGALDEAILHLESARALDPTSASAADLARAFVFLGRDADAEAMLATMHAAPLFGEIWTGRFRMWRGIASDIVPTITPSMPRNVVRFGEIAARVFRERAVGDADLAELVSTARTESTRLRASRFQFIAEFLLYVNRPDEALAMIEESVAAQLQDHQWMQHCSLLAPLRGTPAFEALAATVAARARDVVAMLDSR
jgi:TolB-like protein/tRNA A-37 threonylcarbamoyl transferase component Bud32